MIDDKDVHAEAVLESPYAEHPVAHVDEDITDQSFDEVRDISARVGKC